MFFKKQYENRRYHIVVGIAPTEQSAQQQQVNNIIVHSILNLPFQFDKY